MKTSYKNTDKEGRIRLGERHANKQWQKSELDNGAIVLVPMTPITDEEAASLFNSAVVKHKKTIDLLK